MTNPNPEDSLLARRRELAAQRRECLERPPVKALTRILEHPQPAALVHSFPEEDFLFLLEDLGPDDAQPLIALGSHRQLEYVLDQQVWDRDRIDLKSLSQWLARFVAADAPRMIRWLATEKANLVEFYLFNVLDIRIRAHDQDPSVFGPGFTSIDNFFYVRIRDVPALEALGEVFKKNHRRMISQILENLAEADYVAYQRTLLGAMHVLPAEMEEAAYRLRNVRLAEKGFLPLEEAVGLYQPLRFDRFQQTAARSQVLAPGEGFQLAMIPLNLIESGHLFHQALQALEPGQALDQIQSEFASLCNRLTVADRLKPASRNDLGDIVRKACGYLDIGLERLNPEPPRAANAARSLRAYNLEGLFRLGYSQAVHLKQKAENWVAASWFARGGLPLTFWGERWLGVIGGLLLKRPLYFERDRQGHRYREFAALADVQRTDRQLDLARAIDHLLDQMQIQLPPPRRYGHLTYQSVLLTLWARHDLALSDALQPIAVETFGTFWESLFEESTGEASRGRTRRTIADKRKGDLVAWLARRAGCEADDLTASIGPPLAALFDELEEEYGRVSRAALNPRYIHHFLLAPDDPAAA